MEREKWQRRSGKLICAAIILLGIYVVLKYALGVLIPFIIAYFVASPMVSLADKSSKKFKGSRKAWGIFYILVFWGFIFLMIYVFVAKIISQASDFFDYISKNGDQVKGILKNIVQSIVSLPSRIPFLKNVIEGDSLGNVGQKIGDIMGKAFASLVQKAGEIVGVGITKVAFGTPKAIISLVVCVVSSFYLVIDSEEIKDYLLNIFHFESRERIKRGLLKISLGFRGYVKAYFFLFLITFTELYVGLAVLGRKYSFFIAAVVATLDLLPLFGSGLVLVPWAIALIIGEEYAVGIGMLLIFGIITVVRQIAEPRLVGANLGIHPLASFASMFIGFRVFGFWGMILAPVAILVIKEIIKESVQTRKKEEKVSIKKY